MRILVLETGTEDRQLLKAALATSGFNVVCCADIKSLRRLSNERAPLCIVLRQHLNNGSPTQVVRELRQDGCTAPIVVIGKADIPTAVQAIRAGASDYIVAPFEASELIARVSVAIGEPEGIGKRSPLIIGAEHASYNLLPLEKAVLDYVVQGYSTKEMSKRLSLSPRTVESYRASILRKMNARNTADLVRLALM